MSDTPADMNSGAAGTEYQTVLALRNLGHDVDAVWANELHHRIKHSNLHHILEQPFEYRRIMLAKLSLKKYDVIHINQPHGYLAAKSLKDCSETVSIHRSHGFEMRVENDLEPWLKLYGGDRRTFLRRTLSKFVNTGLRYNCRAITRTADGHIVSASQCADFLRDKMGVSQDRIAVIPQAPPELYTSSPSLPMTKDRLHKVLYVGQFAFFKAPMIVADVMNKLGDMSEELVFSWVCSKEHHSSVYDLLSPSVRNRLNLMDWLPQEKLITVYDNHGIFLFPSFFEGFGKVFLEAMSRGLCVVAADNSGPHDIINNGLNGFLAPTGCVDTMVKICSALINDEPLGIEISKAAIQAAKMNTWKSAANKTISFYEKLLYMKH